ncbi:MAG: hypothetical protein HYS86_01325 [Candidatus Chisholmbacteria bacterium]|nr:hypothetical protein [Candidatus Chisholmbacteria bacterium]
MKKIETVWCQLLFDALERREIGFQQQKLARQLHLSTSTVSHALKDLRLMGGVRIGGDGGEVVDAEKILMHWANQRDLVGDVRMNLGCSEPVQEIEGLMPPGSILGGYSAVRHWYQEAPADYATVYVYHAQPEVVQDRLVSCKPGNTKVVVLQLPPLIPVRAETTSLAHTFVDLWNLTDWMAKDFVRRVKEEIDGLLS